MNKEELLCKRLDMPYPIYIKGCLSCFDSPEGFIKLFNAMGNSDDWKVFVSDQMINAGYLDPSYDALPVDLINPTTFLNAVAEFYGLEE